MNLLFFVTYILLVTTFGPLSAKQLDKRALQETHEKPTGQKWFDKIVLSQREKTRMTSLAKLINYIVNKYLSRSQLTIFCDETLSLKYSTFFTDFVKRLPSTYMFGLIRNETLLNNDILHAESSGMRDYVLVLTDIFDFIGILPSMSKEKVVVYTTSSQWRIREFLISPVSHKYINLLIIGHSISKNPETYVLYTHRLFVDALGSSFPYLLTSWMKSRIVQKNINLFPNKLENGFSGHRFVVTLSEQPPFVVKRVERHGLDEHVVWDGIEIRLLEIISKRLNFTLEYKEVFNKTLGSSDSVLVELKKGLSEVGVAGIYYTNTRSLDFDMSQSHSKDCAGFLTLSATALPKYRAILGPFHWSVWILLIFTYMFAILPLSFSDRHSLRYLWENPGEIENMFWYVFGTFTNCFTFTGDKSWTKSEKVTTKILVGWYWVFSIIITACYTGSIIAFITIPAYPENVNSVAELLKGFFKITTLDHGGWEKWFTNSSEPTVKRLLKHLEYVGSVEDGIQNVTDSFFWNYAFLGSKELLHYIMRTNYTKVQGRRPMFHISNECFVPFFVSMAFPKHSIYKEHLDTVIMQTQQSGLIKKINNDVRWNLYRSAAGTRLSVYPKSTERLSAEDRALTLDDTQGMFLLLAIGFTLGGMSLISEQVGGCFTYLKEKNYFLKRVKNTGSQKSLISNGKSDDDQQVFEQRCQVDEYEEEEQTESNESYEHSINSERSEPILSKETTPSAKTIRRNSENGSQTYNVLKPRGSMPPSKIFYGDQSWYKEVGKGVKNVKSSVLLGQKRSVPLHNIKKEKEDVDEKMKVKKNIKYHGGKNDDEDMPPNFGYFD